MTVHAFKNAVLELPDHWNDRSVTLFSGPARAAVTETLVIDGDDLAQGQTAYGYALKQLTLATTMLRNFKLREIGEAEMHGCAVCRLRFTHAREDGVPIEQEQVIIGSGSRVYVLTATGRRGQFEELGQVLEHALATFRVDGRS